MSGFVYRDYGTPIVLAHMNKVAIKNLYRKLSPTLMVDGIVVLEPRIFFQGVGFAETDRGIRSDKIFKKFLSKMGIKWGDLASQNYNNVENTYFYLNTNKLNHSTQSAAFLSDKLNSKYLGRSRQIVSTPTAIHYDQNQSVGAMLYQIPPVSTVDKYEFYNGGTISSMSSDGYFKLSPTGMYTITQVGADSVANKVQYDATPNTRVYQVKTTNKDNSTSIASVSFTVQRGIVELKITIGGKYPYALTDKRGFPLGIITAHLPTIRSIVEEDPIQYLANVERPAYIDKSDPASFYRVINAHAPIGTVMYNTIDGNIYDTLALLDDGTIYERVPGVFNERISISEIKNWSSTTKGYIVVNGELQTYQANREYSYTIRYRIKNIATTTSSIIAKIREASDKIGVRTPPNYWGYELRQLQAATSAMDTTLNKALYNINTTEYENTTIFYQGHLRKDAFDSMGANAFVDLLSKCFEVGYTEEDSEWWEVVLAVVIVIVAIAAAVVVISYTGQWALATQILSASAAAMAVLTVGGMLYAEYVGNAQGMQLIGAATQITGIVIAIASICVGYVNLQTAIAAAGETVAEQAAAQTAINAGTATAVEGSSSSLLTTYMPVVTAGAELAASVAPIAGQIGIIDNNTAKIIGAMAAVSNMATSIENLKDIMATTDISSLGLNDAFKAASGFLKTLDASSKVYLAFTANDAGIQQAVTEEQAISESGVEAVYIMQEKTYKDDALENLFNIMETRFGLNYTDMILSRTYGV